MSTPSASTKQGLKRPQLKKDKCYIAPITCVELQESTHLGDILAESMAFELLALNPHFCIFLLSLETHCFCSSWEVARSSNSLAQEGSQCSLQGGTVSSFLSKWSLCIFILHPGMETILSDTKCQILDQELTNLEGLFRI